jgi:excisionase family DNA binding protein
MICGRMQKRAFPINEFCERYSIGRTRAYEEIAAGRLRAVKAGRRTLIPADSAEAWFEELPVSRGTQGKFKTSDGQRDG